MRRSASFYDKRISQEVDGKALGDEFEDFIFRIAGGNDKQGFPMMQGAARRVSDMSCRKAFGFRPRWLRQAC